MFELISALMITGKDEYHRFLAEQAVKCFQNQTYQARELIIINTAPTPWFSAISDPCIKEIMIPEGPSLGELRNISMDHAQGDLLFQFDDDDWHHPERMAQQHFHFVPGKINILARQYRINLLNKVWGIADGTEWPKGGITGTMLHERSPHRYPPIPKAEDKQFLQLHPVNVQDLSAEMYVRLYHGHNTWNKASLMKAVASKRYIGNTEFIKSILRIYLPNEGI